MQLYENRDAVNDIVDEWLVSGAVAEGCQLHKIIQLPNRMANEQIIENMAVQALCLGHDDR